MNERSFFDFGSQPGDSERLDSTPWGRRFQDLSHPDEEGVIHDGSVDDSTDRQAADDHATDGTVMEGVFDEDSLPTHGEIIELIETLHAGESSPFLRRETTDRPYSVHLPEHYEAGYAYPLVVWFHGDGSSEAEVSSVISNISERNYIGVALRGNVAFGQGFRWSTVGDDLQKLTSDVESIVHVMRRQYHIHSERIYLAGYGSGASTAMDLILQRPEWFGGAVCLCGSFHELQVSQNRISDLRNKRVLLATAANSRSSKVGDLVAAGRLLYASGMQIGTRVYQDAGSAPSSKMLRDVNHWLMDDVCSAANASS